MAYLQQQQHRAWARPASRASLRPSRLVRTPAATIDAPASTAQQVFNIPRGETNGAAMVVDEVSIQVGDRDLLTDVEWKLMPGHRVGLVGANGAGKSTLLKCLIGSRQVEVGYLEQTAVSGSTLTVWEEARSRMTNLLEAEALMDAAEVLLYAGDPAATEQLKLAQDAYEAAGGPTADKTVANVLTGLGFNKEQFHKNASEFSGGWQMRVALARLLLGPAGQSAAGNGSTGLMLLDEPTNHLDSAACKWLGNFLKNSSGGVVIVRGKKLHHYAGSYSKFIDMRAEREAQLLATANKQQAEIAHLQSFVDRFGAKASKATQAQSRMKMIDKLKDKAVEAPAASSGDGPGDAKKVTLQLPKAPSCHMECIILKDGSIGWGDPKAPGAKPLVTGIDLTVKRGQRILVLGPNGAGKSTLIKAVGAGIPLWAGSKKLGDGVRISYFSQDLAQDLPLGVPALDYVMDKARESDPTITMEKCRQALGAMGLQNSMEIGTLSGGEKASVALAAFALVLCNEIGTLSGGEKARVALAAFALVPCNVLLLDEASNHLDAGTINVLTGALQKFEGAIVAITHNMAFASALNATHVLRVADGEAKMSDLIGELKDSDFDHRPKLNATYVLRVSDSKAKISDLLGELKESDLWPKAPVKAAKGGKRVKGNRPAAVADFAAAPAKAAPAKTVAAAPAKAAPAKAAAPAKSSKRGLSWSEQEEYKKLGKEMSAIEKKRDVMQAQAAAPAKSSKRGLSWSEQEEYKKLGKEMSAIVKKRDVMQAQVSQLSSKGDFKAVTAKSMELASLQEEADTLEWRFMELAEMAGDL
eukprot:gene29123-32341_t